MQKLHLLLELHVATFVLRQPITWICRAFINVCIQNVCLKRLFDTKIIFINKQAAMVTEIIIKIVDHMPLSERGCSYASVTRYVEAEV